MKQWFFLVKSEKTGPFFLKSVPFWWKVDLLTEKREKVSCLGGSSEPTEPPLVKGLLSSLIDGKMANLSNI